MSPYNAQAYEPQRTIPIVTAATAYTDQETGKVFIIVINKALWFGDSLSNSLINPNQLQFAGVHVQGNPFDSAPLAIATNYLTIPLLTQGTNIYFTTTAPSQQELDKYPHVHLTLDTDGIRIPFACRQLGPKRRKSISVTITWSLDCC